MKNKLNSLNIPIREYRTSKKAYLEVPSITFFFNKKKKDK